MHDAQVHMAAVDWTRTSRLVVSCTLTRMLCAWSWAFWVQGLRRERVGAWFSELPLQLHSRQNKYNRENCP